MNLKDLILQKYKTGLLESFFAKKRYKIKKIYESTDLIVITIDYYNNQVKNFKSLWAKEARGRAYAIFKDNIYILKNNLPKGFELFEINKDFDDNYLNISKKFKEGGALEESYLSEKIDGCLITVCIYQKSTIQYQIMSKFLSTIWYVETDQLLFIPASRSTLFLNDDMKKYFLQSFSGYTKSNIEQGWLDHKKLFLELILNIYEKCVPRSNTIATLVFEGVCKNRGFKSELTVLYEFNQFFYLGYCTINTFIPHYKTDQSIVQPDWYKVQSIEQINSILTNLEQNLRYQNKLYPEGFIYFDHFRCNFTPSQCKLKPSVYYKCHKPKTLTDLTSLNDMYNDIYPFVKEVKFVTSDKLELAIEEYKIDLKNSSDKKSLFFKHFPVNLSEKTILKFAQCAALNADVSTLKQFFFKKAIFN